VNRATPSVRVTMFTAVLRADLLVLLKSRRALFVGLLLPLWILFITKSAKGTSSLGGSYYIIGIAVAYGLASFGIFGYATRIARDRDTGVLQRLRVTPAPSWLLMGSRIVAQEIANVIMSLVVVVVGAAMHHLHPSVATYLLVLVASTLGGAVFLGIGQAVVGLVRSADAVNAVARLVFIALIFLGLFAASGTLGATWETVSRWSPVGVVMTVYAGVLDLSMWGSTQWTAVGSCVGYVAVMAAIGVRWFRWQSA
jgi:ABC-2 type transport system permease protein